MKTSWLKGLDDQAQTDIRVGYKASLILRERLSAMCEEKIEGSLSTKKDQYESPSWCYQQADNVGYRRALKEIISLLSE